jgi:LEA14-like dessication related protein
MLSGCAGLVQKPRIHVIGLNYADITKKEQTIGVELAVRNPNYFAIPIQTGTAVITINGSDFAAGKIPHAINLPANSTTDVTVPVKTTTALLKAVIPLVILNDWLAYHVAGYISITGHNKPYPFAYSGGFTLKQISGLL